MYHPRDWNHEGLTEKQRRDRLRRRHALLAQVAQYLCELSTDQLGRLHRAIHRSMAHGGGRAPRFEIFWRERQPRIGAILQLLNCDDRFWDLPFLAGLRDAVEAGAVDVRGERVPEAIDREDEINFQTALRRCGFAKSEGGAR